MSEFRYKRRVEFAETDMAGIVHFSAIFRYMEEAEHAMWRSVGLSIGDTQNGLAWPRIAAACEFRNPLYFEDQVEVWVRLAAVKTRALDYEFTLVRGDTVIAVGTMTSVCVRKSADGTMKAAELPHDIVEKLRNA